MVTTEAAVIEQLTNHAEQLAAFGVVRYGLFGSFVRDAPRSTSDVDMLVEFNRIKKLLSILCGLQNCLKRYSDDRLI